MLFGAKGGAEWLFVFLGNPGPRYAGTRHNAGFMVGEALSKSLGVKINRARWRALTATADVSGHKVLLMLPQTLMNLSGEAVGPAAKFYKLPPERVLVFSDEMALPPGSVRIRTGGSAGGHNGLKSIIAAQSHSHHPGSRLWFALRGAGQDSAALHSRCVLKLALGHGVGHAVVLLCDSVAAVERPANAAV